MTGTTRSAFHLSALVVAAGTILGLASGAAAQSRLERAEKALAQAQRELEQARRDAGQSKVKSEGGQKIEMRCEVVGDCPQGCEPCDDEDCDSGACEDQVCVIGQGEWTTNAGDEFEVVVGQPGQHRSERTVTVVGGEGHNCPACGRAMEGGQAGAWRVQGHPIDLHGMMQGMHGGQAGGPHVQFFGDAQQDGDRKVIRLRGEPLNGEWRTGGEKEVIILRGEGPGGEWRAHGPAKQEHRIQVRRLGGEGGENEVIVLRGEPLDGERQAQGRNQRIEIRRLGDEGGDEGGGGQPRKTIRLDGGHGAGHGAGHGGVTGKVIIVGPDGERQEFDLGGMGGAGGTGDKGSTGGKATIRRIPRVQIEEFRDGDAAPAHPVQGDRTIRVRKVTRGSAL